MGTLATKHSSNVVFVRLFTFTFDQLQAKVESNTIRCTSKRVVKLLKTLRSQLPAQIDRAHFDVLPFAHIRATLPDDAGCWEWSAANLSEMLAGDEDLFRPVHLVSTDSGSLVFTFR